MIVITFTHDMFDIMAPLGTEGPVNSPDPCIYCIKWRVLGES